MRHNFLSLSALTLALSAAALPAAAQTPSFTDMSQPPNIVESAKATDNAMARGEILKIDSEAQKITLKHGPIKNLEMAAMTMSFRVTDAKMLQGLAVGQTVDFSADKIGGVYTLLKLAPVKP